MEQANTIRGYIRNVDHKKYIIDHIIDTIDEGQTDLLTITSYVGHSTDSASEITVHLAPLLYTCIKGSLP